MATSAPEPAYPIGPLVDDGKTAQTPLPVIRGQHVILRHLEPHHAKSLWSNIKDDKQLWDYMPVESFSTFEEFEPFIESRSQSTDPYFYAIIDEQQDGSEDVVGQIALMNFAPSHRSDEVGHVLFSKKLQKSTKATETVYLLLKASFETLNSRRVEWKTNTFNQGSRKAALRFGFTYEGIFRNHYIIKGRSRDTIWFSIIESEWPARKNVFERWLDADNFDQGKQIKSLTEIAAMYT
jgi:RimJ/RimL family protein N-acetyltransferase